MLAGADVLLGVSARGAVSYEGVRSMADKAIVFALANPVPEIRPEEMHPDNIIPSVFNRRVAESVAEAVADAASASGTARHAH